MHLLTATPSTLAAILIRDQSLSQNEINSMKRLLTIVFLTISVSSFGQKNKETKTYYKSGQLQTERKLDSVCNCYKVKEYYESGNIKSTRTESDGEYIYYYENGTLGLYQFWKNGALEGRAYSNFTNGKLGYEHFFNNKFRSGTWKSYNNDGTLSQEEIFQENKTPWDSNDDYATNKFYFNNKLAYTVELVAGKKTNLTIIDTDSYDKLVASERPTGEKLFVQDCSSCHSASVDIVGPKLKGVTDNRTNEWLIKMITNGDALVKSGDKDAVALYKKWNNIQHPNFERLSNEDVTAIINYLKTLK
jgi:antitoxin component YwqK of YwqJK toxin-antitoxin module/cytochrome c551/c552